MPNETHLAGSLNPGGQIVGYARVSTSDQNLSRQLSILSDHGATRIFTDSASGAHLGRPGLDEALRYLRDGDLLVVSSMDRLARSVVDLYSTIDDLVAKGVNVRFIKEAQTYGGEEGAISRLMLGLLGSVAEFERYLIRERQAEGIRRAKERGVYDRTPKLSQADIEEARKLIRDGVPKAAIARRLGVGRTTLYRSLSEN